MVLVNGRIVGAWVHETQRGITEVRVALFDELSGEQRPGLAAEAELYEYYPPAAGARTTR